MTEETMHEYVARRLEEHGLPKLEPMKLDMSENFAENLNKLLIEHSKKWETVGIQKEEISMQMVSGMMWKSIQIFKDGGASEGTVRDMIDATIVAVMRGDISSTVNRIKGRS